MKNLVVLMLLLSGVVLFEGCKDPCKDVTCLNGGACDEETGDCQCAAGYEGADCGTAMNAKFVGTWTVTEACVPGGSKSYQLILDAVSGRGDSLIISNINNIPGNSVRGKVESDGLTFQFAKQASNVFDSYESVSGSLSADFSTISFAYNYYFGNATSPTQSCTITGVK